MSFKATPEQENCIRLSKEHAVLKLEAGAGCTKTTSLSLVAKENRVPSIYLAFNKVMAEEAKLKFPDWVQCKTTHSLAYGVFGVKLQQKLKRPLGPYKNVCGTGNEIARYYKMGQFPLPDQKLITASGMGAAVKETVAKFEASGDTELKEHHVSYAPAKSSYVHPEFPKKEYAALVLSYAKLLWKERIDPNSPILATHDTYLKLYQLSNPDLSQYQMLYLDEAQDSSDCVVQLVKSQKGIKIILVGDSAQAIYGWRGAINAMNKFDGAVGQLTKSFRFGPAIAAAAGDVLALKTTGALKLQGWEQLESVVVDYLDGEEEGPICQLYRTNAALILDSVTEILAGKQVAMEIDVRDFVSLLNSALALWRRDMKNVKHEDITPYDSWDSLMEDSEHVGGELKRIVNIISSGEYTRVLRALEDYKKPEKPDLIMTTAHKSKGREFEIVVLADDFPSVYDREGEWIGLEDTEANLLYVAVTRAKKKLVRNQTLRDIQEKLHLSTMAFLAQEVCELQLDVA